MNQGAGYLSFDLHYRFASGWECVLFYGRNTRLEYWDVVDEGVGEGYGYSTREETVVEVEGGVAGTY